MLEPQTRAALSEQLKPPSGFELAHAVGTTFTLDLTTALTVPLSFAAHRVADHTDPIGVLDAVRRSADRIDLFAQAGAISMGATSDLVAFLEPMIHPVNIATGLFHPKVWLLEYRAGDETRFRFICASRNLTADRSWDVVVRLDGWVADERYRDDAAATNPPLRSFLRALPDLALHTLSEERRNRILALGERALSIAWETPDDMRGLAFHPLGVPGASRPDLSGKRALIVSPFLSDDGLALLRQSVDTDTHVVSRAASLDELRPESLNGMHSYLLDDAATQLSDDTDTISVVSPTERLNGLHAKVVVVDRGHHAHVLLGSANATGAAWNGNVEFMVELVGSLHKFGVEATLDALGELTEPYPAVGGEEADTDEEAKRALDGHLRRLAAVPLWARVLPGEPYGLRVWADEQIEPVQHRLEQQGIQLSWHLLTRPDHGGTTLGSSEHHGTELPGLPLTDVTPFIVFVVRDREGRQQSAIQLAQLLDDVDTRRDAIVARQLTDRAAFIRLLTLMLELAGVALEGANASTAQGFFGTGASGAGSGLFEALMRAVGDGQAGLADVRRIVELVRGHGDEHRVLPDGFDELWEQVWTAHLELGGAS